LGNDLIRNQPNETIRILNAMNARIGILFVLPVLVACMNFLVLVHVPAQTFTNLHSFGGANGEANPFAGLTISGNRLFGTTVANGNGGSVFAINTDGSGFTNLQAFDINIFGDGFNPISGVTLSGNTLYGTTLEGGSSLSGTVFAINTNGTQFTYLYNLNGGNDGFYPRGRLVLSGNTLYGTTANGGPNGNYGTIFAFNIASISFSNLHSFTATSGGYTKGTNSDGANPDAGPILSGNILYGTTVYGGNYGYGTIYAINTDSTGFTNLHSFTGGSDGAYPQGGLILSSNILYGTAQAGGTNGNGTVFAVNTNGTSFKTLYAFTATDGNGDNSDGARPYSALILSGNTLYGTTPFGGANAYGTVFAINTDGTGFTNLYSFTGGSDGGNPWGSLVLSGNTLYGTANVGGTIGYYGTVFGLSLPLPQLTISPSGTNVVLTWPPNVTGFVLQTSTNLSSPVWVTLIGQNAVTNSITDVQRFYRLRQ
jgi:uncharacterized repeat protein (TIGR03803 family)